MLRLRALVGALSLVSLPLFAGCTCARPSIDGWAGCVFDNAQHDMLHGETIPKPAAGSFVYIYSKWQRHPLEAQGRMSDLEIDFPGSLRITAPASPGSPPR